MKYTLFAILVVLVALSQVTFVAAQSTTFTYQGKLTDTNLPANGTYDFQFILLSGSPPIQVGSTLMRPGTVVSNGVFTVQLDFTVAPINPFLSGSDMVLQIGVKKPTDAGFTILAPNQPITSAPYAIRSEASGSADTAADSQKLGGISAAQYVLTGDSRLTDSRNPLPNSPNYIQNGVALQGAADFNISGTGSASSFNSGTGYRILNNPAFSADASGNTYIGFNITFANGGTNNTFAGNLAGHANTAGFSNSFFGQSAGLSNFSGVQNSFFGANAGSANTSGSGNSFFGESSGASNNANANAFFGNGSGASNTIGFENSFFGFQAGNSNLVGSRNSFFGFRAGLGNTDDNNSFFGDRSGQSNSSGHDNDFYGSGAGASNTTGVFNSFFGSGAGAANTTSGNNSFFGANAGNKNTGGSSNAFFGNAAGLNNTNGLSNSFFGVNAGITNSTGSANTFVGQNTGANVTTGGNNTFLGAGAGNVFGISGTEGGNTMIGEATGYLNGVISSTAIGIGASATSSHTINLGTTSENTIVWGKLLISSLGTTGGTALCLNGSNTVAFCSSSLRYKKDLSPFTGGLDLVKRFQPITFTWRDNGRKDLGLGAEDVAKIDPLLITYNATGEIEGVKYDRISVVLLNAVKEQQKQIDTQAAQIRRQQADIDALREALCSDQKSLDICKTSR